MELFSWIKVGVGPPSYFGAFFSNTMATTIAIEDKKERADGVIFMGERARDSPLFIALTQQTQPVVTRHSTDRLRATRSLMYLAKVCTLSHSQPHSHVLSKPSAACYPSESLLFSFFTPNPIPPQFLLLI